MNDFDNELKIIKGKAWKCDICMVPESIKDVIHVSSHIMIPCTPCYMYIEKKSSYDPRNANYPRDRSFWVSKHNYGDVIDFSNLDHKCDKCGKKSWWYTDFMYHIFISEGKAISMRCDDCYK